MKDTTAPLKEKLEAIRALRQPIEAQRKKSEMIRNLTIFAAGYDLNDLEYIGACLQQPARLGFYFGDMSLSQYADGSNRIDSNSFNKTLVSVASSIASRVKPYVSSDVRFSLESDVQYFRFVPGREVPYFSQGVIDRNNAYLNSTLAPELRSYAALGESAGALNRIDALFKMMRQF
jgi:hypothetical protein